MMEGWNTQFGEGAKKVVNEALNRGAIGKAKRHFRRWWNQAAEDREAIAAVKAKKIAEAEEISRLADEHFEHEKIRLERENVRQLRAAAQRRELVTNQGGARTQYS